MAESRFKSAFKEDANLVGLAAALGLSILFMNPLPLLLGVGLEAGYLLFVPESEWYTQRLKKRAMDEIKQRRTELEEKLGKHLDYENRERYERLRDLREHVDEQVLPTKDSSWYEEIFAKLDSLLEKFLIFAYRDSQNREYLAQKATEMSEANMELRGKGGKKSDLRQRLEQTEQVTYNDPTKRWVEEQMLHIREFYANQLSVLQQLLDEENKRTEQGNGDYTNKTTLERRIQVLQMSLDDIEQVAKTTVSLSQQLQLMEDTFNLINGQIRSKAPKQVLEDVEQVVVQAEMLQSTLSDINIYQDEDDLQQYLSVGSK